MPDQREAPPAGGRRGGRRETSLGLERSERRRRAVTRGLGGEGWEDAEDAEDAAGAPAGPTKSSARNRAARPPLWRARVSIMRRVRRTVGWRSGGLRQLSRWARAMALMRLTMVR